VTQEKRQHYRVSPSTEREVVVHVRLANGQESRAGLLDVSAGGVALAYPKEHPLDVAIAESVSVLFQSDRLGAPLVIAGYVRRIKLSEDGTTILYGVAFDAWSANRSDLTPKLRALFNEREAVRVEPREDEDVDVEVVFSGKASRVDGTLRDISVLGIGVWVSVDDQPALEDGSTVQVDLTLPTGEKALNLEVEVRHVQSFGERARVGLRLNSEMPQVRRSNERNIGQYVMARQIEAARIDAERRRAMESHYPTG